jgi:hypothetical protein
MLFALALVVPALAGCGQIWPGGGDRNESAENTAQAGNGITFTGDGGQTSHAGITDQRTLASLMGGNGTAAAEGDPDASVESQPGPYAATGKPPLPPVETASATRAVGVDPSLLIGNWGDNGDCSQGIELRRDGTFVTSSGAVGNWSLNGDMLTMSGQNGSFRARLRAVDRWHLVVVNPNGSIGRSQRC